MYKTAENNIVSRLMGIVNCFELKGVSHSYMYKKLD